MKLTGTCRNNQADAHAAKTKSLQYLVSLSLVLRKAHEAVDQRLAPVSSMPSSTQPEKKQSSAVSQVSASQTDTRTMLEGLVGPRMESMDWFETMAHIVQLLQGLATGDGFPEWFVRRAWLDNYAQRCAIVRESQVSTWAPRLLL